MVDDLDIKVVDTQLGLGGVQETVINSYFNVIYFSATYFDTSDDVVGFGAPKLEVVNPNVNLGVLPVG